VPHNRLGFHPVDDVALLGSPESSDECNVFGIVEVHPALLVVLELGVVNGFLGNCGASEQPHTFDFEAGLLTQDDVSGEGVLSELVESLQETLAEVLSLVKDLTLSLVLVVVEEPD